MQWPFKKKYNFSVTIIQIDCYMFFLQAGFRLCPCQVQPYIIPVCKLSIPTLRFLLIPPLFLQLSMTLWKHVSFCELFATKVKLIVFGDSSAFYLWRVYQLSRMKDFHLLICWHNILWVGNKHSGINYKAVSFLFSQRCQYLHVTIRFWKGITIFQICSQNSFHRKSCVQRCVKKKPTNKPRNEKLREPE